MAAISGMATRGNVAKQRRRKKAYGERHLASNKQQQHIGIRRMRKHGVAWRQHQAHGIIAGDMRAILAATGVKAWRETKRQHQHQRRAESIAKNVGGGMKHQRKQ